MPGLVQKIQQFLRSPQGRRVTDQAKRYAQCQRLVKIDPRAASES